MIYDGNRFRIPVSVVTLTIINVTIIFLPKYVEFLIPVIADSLGLLLFICLFGALLGFFFCSMTVNTGAACKGFLFNILLNVVTMSPKNTLEDDIFMQLTSYKFPLRQLSKCVIFPRALHFKETHKIIKTSMNLFIATQEIFAFNFGLPLV